MGSSKYIGRVGALAVALGIGTALASGAGIAQADTGGDQGKNSSSHSSSTSGSKASGSKASGPKAANAKAPESKAAAASTTTRSTRQSPLSKLGSQVRKDVNSNLDNVADTLRRNQTQASKTLFSGTRSGTTSLSKIQLGKTQPSKSRPKPAKSADARSVGTTNSTRGASEARTTVADTVPVSPSPSRVQRPASGPLKNLTERITAPVTKGLDAASTQRPTALVTKVANELSNALPGAAPARQEVAAPAITAPPVISALLASAGLSPFTAGSNPTTPAPSPAAWGLMAWARRETARTISPNGTSLVSATDAASVVAESNVQPMAAAVDTSAAATSTDPNKLTAKPDAPQVGDTTSVGWVTGDTTSPWFVGGTDLGVMWDNGGGKVLTMFGDTFNDSAMTTGWRNNVLFRTGDRNLSDGLKFDEAVVTPGGTGPGTNYDANTWWGPGTAFQNGLGAGPIGASQVILANPTFNGLLGTTYTMIPTSAISVTDSSTNATTQYVTVMSVRTWDNPGSWTTNYSAIAYSTDGGEHWTVDPSTVRASGFLRTNQNFVAGNQNFQQNALVYGNPNDSASYVNGDINGERYVYVYGTPSGRQGSAYVARISESDLTNLNDYEYWSGEDSGWVKGDPSAATSVIGGGDSNYLPLLPKTGFLGQISKGIAGFVNGIWVGGIPTGGNVSEMSVQYNEYLGKYVVLYTDGGNNVVMRVSDSPQGTWSDAATLVANNSLVTDPKLGGAAQSGMYGPMIHPWSGTDQLGTGNEQYLYYNLSYWDAYNVALKQTDLGPAKSQYT